MSKSLQGKIALVTGASRGIGAAIAKGLAADGALVAVHFGGSADAAEQVVKDIKAAGGDAFTVQADLSQAKGPSLLFDGLDRELESRTGSKKFDILVNNAGVAPMAPFTETDEATFDTLYAVNIKALFFITQLATDRLRDGGRVINIGSAGSRVGLTSSVAYAATKGWVDSFTLSAAGVFGARNITVNAIAPGVIRTDMSGPVFANGEEPILQGQILKRVGEGADIANLARALAGPGGGWTTGQTIDASGGTLLAFG
ncbi:MAG TPA: SDR family NAD(P)-dependent oxidoreductase [Verrucomicrobiae bacterium]|nr:SDR family NAD(P)-dependent oxidoreductase [Verrucomicrobiae bacterium]